MTDLRPLLALIRPLCPVVIALVLMWAVAARADLFEIGQVGVDITAASADEARQQALSAAERKAFDRLLERLVDDAARARLQEVDAASITALVSDLAVTRERASATRYIGEFTVRFRPDAVRTFLANRGIALMATESPPVVVLPVFRQGEQAVLWDYPNPWRDAWDAAAKPAELVPVILPEGDLRDVASISADRALAGDRAAFLDLAGRYGSSEVIVALADAGVDPATGRPALTVDVRRYGGDGVTTVLQEAIPTGADGSADGQFAAAVRRVGAAIDAAWRGSSTVELESGEPAVLAVTAPIGSLGDWIALQRRLNANPAVRKIDVVLLARTEVRLNLHYLGSLDQFSVVLGQSDLALERRDDGWVLSLAGGPAAGTP